MLRATALPSLLYVTRSKIAPANQCLACVFGLVRLSGLPSGNPYKNVLFGVDDPEIAHDRSFSGPALEFAP